jgi:hypothetical protein
MKTQAIFMSLSISILMFFVQCTKEENIINVYSENENKNESPKYEKVITDYGAIGDGETDCSDIINNLIQEMPASGGVIIIPEGDFVLDAPITVNKNYITIKGVNPGIRSNVDVDIDELLGPGGGSKLILRDATYGIHVPLIDNVDGGKNRISSLEIKDLLISGGSSNNGTGIYIQQDNDRCRISNIIGINLNFGINVNAADAMIISDCWISEVQNSIIMTSGIQNMITNCQLGAQPSGITCKLVSQENFVFTSNHIYPDGANNLVLTGCTYVNITANNFQSYYVGMLELNGTNNLVSGNIFWMRNSTRQITLNNRGKDYGVIRIEGSSNQISTNTVKCDWRSPAANPVTIRSVSGENNTYNNLTITDQASTRVFYVNETTRILDCVPVAKVLVDGDASKVFIRY